jgi:hypothetical protein
VTRKIPILLGPLKKSQPAPLHTRMETDPVTESHGLRRESLALSALLSHSLLHANGLDAVCLRPYILTVHRHVAPRLGMLAGMSRCPYITFMTRSQQTVYLYLVPLLKILT